LAETRRRNITGRNSRRRAFFFCFATRSTGQPKHSPYPRCRFQEPTGEQHGTLERSAAVVARAHRVGHKKRHRAHRFGARVRRRGCAAETAGERNFSVSSVGIVPKEEETEIEDRNSRALRIWGTSLLRKAGEGGASLYRVARGFDVNHAVRDSSGTNLTGHDLCGRNRFRAVVLAGFPAFPPRKLIGRMECNYA